MHFLYAVRNWFVGQPSLRKELLHCVVFPRERGITSFFLWLVTFQIYILASRLFPLTLHSHITPWRLKTELLMLPVTYSLAFSKHLSQCLCILCLWIEHRSLCSVFSYCELSSEELCWNEPVDDLCYHVEREARDRPNNFMIAFHL